MPYTPRQYARVQLISYQVPTLAVTAPGAPPAPVTEPAILSLRNSDGSANADQQARVKRMLEVVRWAKANVPGQQLGGSDTLKVFIAPEFYFRDSVNGYSWNSVVNLMEALKSVFRTSEFADWLIVPGTIFSHQVLDPAKNDGKTKAYFNTLVVIKGGSDDAPSTFVHKKFMSTIDIDANATLLDAAANPAFQAILGSWAERKERIARIDNVTLGLEVCLDHGLYLDPQRTQPDGALHTVVRDFPQQEGRPAPEIDLHLISSCGMSIGAPNVCARVGGHVMICDGHPGQPQRTGTKRVTARQGTQVTLSDQDTGGQSTWTPTWRQALPAQLELARPNTANAWFTQEIVCFRPVAAVPQVVVAQPV